MSYVYLVPLVDRSSFKVGKAKHPGERCCQLGRAHPLDVKNTLVVYCGSTGAAFKLEKLIHTHFSSAQAPVSSTTGGTEFFGYACLVDVIAFIGSLGYSVTPIPATMLPHGPEEVMGMIQALAIKVKRRRINLRMTQQELAIACGISERTIRNLESAKSVSLDSFLLMAKTLGMTDVIHAMSLEPEAQGLRVRHTI